ncbi:NAD(P)-dependent oxidoreductase [Rhizobium halophytocola]|uniref:3-hydroxyisobutyrate dehydrogenase-like beta-hydroxyacid dehydrogenase n=1 Tax=Rhizobium halophytocola TaxID=735519 RepID=A0ABS4DUZ0_9HYPH|nr:NAD(P)-dependent oxidoreductase [Rhizobium halophytocola]MBP1849513.1 3-hydroxyisobutyrate dehydrogenase-like beta-hydroxyacid dehydrogenase [Rhizobium halophytocola]
MKIAFIGFGEAARAFTDSLAGKDGLSIIAAYDVKQDAAMIKACEDRGLSFKTTPGEAIAEADWIVSAVTADQSLIAARAAVDELRQGQVFIDINSVSPDRKRETAALVEGREAHYLDMAVMAPVHPRGHATPVLLAGEPAERLAPELQDLGFKLEVIGPKPGAATAIKMVRSLFVKGLEALTVETLLAASVSGCFDRVLTSLSSSYPGLGWPDVASYNFERTLHHGVRRAAEMRESAATLTALGLTGELADRIADVQAAMGAVPAKALGDTPLEEAVAEIARQRLENREA